MELSVPAVRSGASVSDRLATLAPRSRSTRFGLFHGAALVSWATARARATAARVLPSGTRGTGSRYLPIRRAMAGLSALCGAQFYHPDPLLESRHETRRLVASAGVPAGRVPRSWLRLPLFDNGSPPELA